MAEEEAITLFANLTPHSDARASVNTLADLYKTALDTCGRPLAEVFTVLSYDGFPALIHCTAGKDRTGIVVALLLSLAGVDTDTIAEDYALTGTYIQNLLVELRQEAVIAGRDSKRYERMLEHTPDAMLTMLTHLEEQYGGSEAYLKGVGSHENQIKGLQTALIE
jgi:protein-tyrosine phosphatase